MESPSVAGGGAVNVPTANAAAATVPATSAPTSITAYPSPHLKKVLRSYQSAASSSLSGPNGILSAASHHHHPADLVYYSYSNLPLPVVGSSSPAGKAAARIVVKDEPVEELHLPYHYHCQSPPVSLTAEGGIQPKNGWPKGVAPIDEFKLWKLKRPVYTSAIGKDAVDLSSGRDKVASLPATAAAPVLEQETAVLVKAPPSPPQIQLPIQQPTILVSPGPSFPILSAADRGWKYAERSETTLEGHRIACFTVGGEPRLCLPQILNSVLRQFHIVQIHAVCDELQINCSRCTAEQLDSLKASPAIIPRTAASCGLITKSDAQRLCSALLRRASAMPTCRNVKIEADPGGRECEAGWFRVHHQCFGKCEGLCRPELYNSPDSGCIECMDCGLLLSPADFVGHAHRSVENRTCHWGFDSANWRSYLLLARRQQGLQHKPNDVLLRQLDEFKNRFLSLPTGTVAASVATATMSAIKRKLQSRLADEDAEDVHGVPDKRRYASGPEGSQSPKPFNATLRESPPPLEEVSSPRVRHDEAGHPNVALAPPRHRPLLPGSTIHPLCSSKHQQPDPSFGNPEIELSSTDTEDSDSIPYQSEDDKSVWELPAHLSDEVDEVEQLLRRGGCDSTNGRLVLQAFRRMCLRLHWVQEQQRQHEEPKQLHHQSSTSSSPPGALLKLRTDLTEPTDEGSKYSPT